MQLVEILGSNPRNIVYVVLSILCPAAGFGLEIYLLLRFNFSHNHSQSIASSWAESPANFLGQSEIYFPSALIWVGLLVSALIVGKFGHFGLTTTIGLIAASTSGIAGILWLDLFLLHNWLGFDDYRPNVSYWWVVGGFWLTHMLLALAAIRLIRPSKKIGRSD